MALDLERPDDFDGMRYGGRRATMLPPAPGCYAISAVDGAIATAEGTGDRATFVCDDAVETFYALSSDASIATAEGSGDRATFVH